MFANVIEQTNKGAEFLGTVARDGAEVSSRYAADLTQAFVRAGQRTASIVSKQTPGANPAGVAAEGVESFLAFSGEASQAARQYAEDSAKIAGRVFEEIWNGFDRAVEKAPGVPAAAREAAGSARVAAKAGFDAVSGAAKAGAETVSAIGAAVERAAKAGVAKGKSQAK